jgi:hypothetical protein
MSSAFCPARPFWFLSRLESKTVPTKKESQTSVLGAMVGRSAQEGELHLRLERQTLRLDDELATKGRIWTSQRRK